MDVIRYTTKRSSRSLGLFFNEQHEENKLYFISCIHSATPQKANKTPTEPPQNHYRTLTKLHRNPTEAPQNPHTNATYSKKTPSRSFMDRLHKLEFASNPCQVASPSQPFFSQTLETVYTGLLGSGPLQTLQKHHNWHRCSFWHHNKY